MGPVGFAFFYSCVLAIMLCALILAVKANWPDGVIMMIMAVMASTISIQWKSYRTYYRQPDSDPMSVKLTLTSELIIAVDRGLELRAPWSEARQVILCGSTASIEMAPEAWIIVTEDQSQTPTVSMEELASFFSAQGVKVRTVRP